MAKKDLPSPEVLRQLLRYEPDTGKLFWRARTPELFADTRGRSARHSCNLWNARYAGKEAFVFVDPKGYLKSDIFDFPHQAQRVIWAMQTGAWAEEQVDHKDNNPSNNRLDNLRPATWSQNQQNKGIPKNNTSGFKGVSWCKRRGQWHVAVKCDGKHHNIGYFGNIQEAANAAVAARNRLHGEFARHE